MIDMFDTLGATLNDIIGSHENNNVGYMGKELGFASGGLAEDTATTDEGPVNLDNPASIVKALGKAATGTVLPGGGSSGLYDNPALGKLSSYNSPLFLTGHLTSAGRFFTNSEPGNLYTNRYKTPEQQKAPVSDSPNTFYDAWLQRTRQFAQADEISNRGQPQVRTR